MFRTIVWGRQGRVTNIGHADSVTVLGQPVSLARQAEKSYLQWFEAELQRRNLGELTYVELRAAQVAAPTTPTGDYWVEGFEDRRQRVRNVRQQLRLLRDDVEGGEGATARLASASGKSSLVRDVTTLLQHAREPIVLLGDPGSGKSTTLREVGIRLAHRAARRAGAAIPIYVELRGYRSALGEAGPDDILEFVRSSVPPAHPAIRAHLAELAQQGRLVILFDGMDEMERTGYETRVERLSAFAGDYHGQIRCLFACRTSDFLPTLAHRQIVLMPFDARQVRTYVERNFELPVQIEGQQLGARALTRRLMASRELGDAVTNPLTLYLIRHFLDRFRRWPTGRSELFESYVKSALRRASRPAQGKESSHPDTETIIASLAELAFEIARARGGVYLEVGSLAASWGVPRTEQIVDYGLRSGLLTLQLAESENATEVETALALQPSDAVGFYHHRLQEYLCANHLSRQLQAIAALDWNLLLDSARWQETLLHVVAARGVNVPPIESLATSLEQISVRIAAALEERSSLAREKEEIEERIEMVQFEDPDDLESGEERLRSRLGEIEERLRALLWTMPTREESRLANRVVLAARVAAEPQPEASAEEAPAVRLHEALLDAVEALATHGRPTSQVKMLWAWREAPAVVPLSAVAEPLRSRIGWVRDQALLVFGELAAARRSGPAGLGKELEYDFGNGSLLGRIGTYAKIARGSPKDAMSVAWAAFCAVAQVITCTVLCLCVLRLTWDAVSTEGWERVRLTSFAEPYAYWTFALAPIVLAALAWGQGTLVFSRRVARLSGLFGTLLLLLTGLAPVVPPALASLGISGAAPPGLARVAIALLPFILTALAFLVSVFLAFLALTAPRVKKPGWRVFGVKSVPLLQHLALEMSIAFAAFAALLGWAFSVVIQIVQVGWPPIANYAIIAIVMLGLVYLAWRDRESLFGLLMMGAVLAFVFGTVLLLAKVVPAVIHAFFRSTGLEWLQAWLADALEVLGFVIVGALIAIAVFAAISGGFGTVRRLLRAQWDRLIASPAHALGSGRFIPQLQSAETFAEILKDASPHRQATLLGLVSRERFGFTSSRDLLALIESCEALVQHEPALGVYWRRRHELEETLKQEMTASMTSEASR